MCQAEPPAQEQTAAGGNGSPGLEVFKQGLTLQGSGGGDCSTWLEVGLFILGRSGVTWVSALPTPASGALP